MKKLGWKEALDKGLLAGVAWAMTILGYKGKEKKEKIQEYYFRARKKLKWDK